VEVELAMNYLKRISRKNGEDAISPVIGVMLMLVVTIIVAAVVSGFGAGLVNGPAKAPTLSMNVQIINTGSYIGSGFSANVLGTSSPINTANLKLITSWTTTMKINSSQDLPQALQNMPDGTVFVGGNVTLPNQPNMVSNFNPGMGAVAYIPVAVAPFGMGGDINATQADSTDPYAAVVQYFGNYSLVQGVGLFAYPYGTASGQAIGGVANNADKYGGYNGVVPYAYDAGGSNFIVGSIDPAIAVLGGGWEQLRAGDTVHVTVIDTKMNEAIYSQDITVTEG